MEKFIVLIVVTVLILVQAQVQCVPAGLQGLVILVFPVHHHHHRHPVKYHNCQIILVVVVLLLLMEQVVCKNVILDTTRQAMVNTPVVQLVYYHLQKLLYNVQKQ